MWALIGLVLAGLILSPLDCKEQMEALDKERLANVDVNATVIDDDWKTDWVCDKTEDFLMHSAWSFVFQCFGMTLHCVYVMVRISKKRGYHPGGLRELIDRALDAKSYIGNADGAGAEKWGPQIRGLVPRSFLQNTMGPLSLVFSMRISLTAGVAYILVYEASSMAYNIPNLLSIAVSTPSGRAPHVGA